MVELLSTKFYIPQPRANLISRPRLLASLNTGLDRKLTLIAAPPGFGKTTLLSTWVLQSRNRVSWLSLDNSDDDPNLFWAYFINSLQQIYPELGKDALALLQSPQAPPIQSILTALINEVMELSGDISIVLDDYHTINHQPIHTALTFLIDHLPENMHLVITTRVDPPLPLARIRAHDQLTELRANDLRFTPEEATAFLNQAMGYHLSPDEVTALESHTEGWIAGLQIAALSLRGRDDIPKYIQGFSGSHRHILGYLGEEVLNHQPEDTIQFLLQTSILDRMCGPLCEAVTGQTNGQETLHNLEQANLFIIPLDDEGVWYRYHRLFAEVLQARLQRTWRDQVQELHRLAGDWFERQGMFDEAVHHELASANYEQAAHLIESVAGNMLRQGLAASLIRWLEAVPDETILAHPRLCLARGWASLWGPDFSLANAEKWAQIALQGMPPGQNPAPDLEGEVYALKALIAADRVQLPLSRELSHMALEYLPAGSPWLGVTTFCLGSALFAAGEFSAATPILTEALRLSRADGELYIQLIAASFLADMQMFQGYLGRAREMYSQVLAWSNHRIAQKGALISYAGLANVLCEQNQLDAALTHVQLGVEQLEQVGGPGAALWLYQALARIQQAKGNWPAALDALDRAYQSGESAQVPFVMAQAAALRAKVLLARGDLETATAWAVDSGLNPEDPEASHAGLRELEYLTYARVLGVQGRHAEALSLLDRLLKAAESEERTGSVIQILVLQSIIFQKKSDPHALTLLVRALNLAEPEGYIRAFVDEGDAMHLLLSDNQAIIRQRIGEKVNDESLRILAYTENLIAASSQSASGGESKVENTFEPLSDRELDILRLIATGRSNQEIAELLMIAISTVKSHINSLYSKLGTQRRTQAILIARERGLISE